MNATQFLKDEHKVIKLVMDVLERICGRLIAGESVDSEHLEKIVDCIRVFADHSHHAKEEDLLFPEMEKAGIPRQGGPIGVMLSEHDEGRGYVKGMLEGIERYKKDGGGVDQIVKNAQQYMQLLRQHIDKEDQILYMMADQRLSLEAQKKLLNDFQRMEAEQTGFGQRAKVQEFLEKMNAKY